jgi:energy-coupling factor transporter transmembrane protein EcfT
MAEALIFHFQKGDSLIHRMDVSVKLLFLLSFSLLLLPVNLFRLIVLLPILLLAHTHSSLRIGTFLKESLFFLIMGAVIFVTVSISSGSLLSGALKTVRFFAILWMALIFTFTTDPLSVNTGVYRLLRPVPFLPARQISTILGLSLTMLPIILDQIREIKEAMWSRCGMSRRTPIRNMIRLGLPLMDGILVKAEYLSDAMEARLFNEDATPPEQGKNTNRMVVLFILILIITAVLGTEKFLEMKDIPLFLLFYKDS